jgi:nucleoid-associated protein EbfC
MDMFKMLKEANAMRSKLSEMEKSLKDKTIEVQENGIYVKANGKSDILDLKISPDVLTRDISKIEKDILSAVQSAVKKSRALMAEEAKKITGGISIPGLM